MHKRLARFVSSLLIVCMVAASWPSSNSISVSAAAAPLIYEDFEDGLADNFVLSPGSGAYEVAAVNGNQVYRSNYNGPQYTTYQASNLPDDYSVEAKVRLNSWGTSTPATVGLFLNYTDTEHYYAVGYEKSSNATGGSRFSIRKRFQGATTYLAAQSSTTPFSLNTDIVMKGEIVGNQIRLYVNGALLLEATDSAPFTSGNPGLYALRTNIEYDNFAVYDATPAAVPQAPTNLSVTSKTETTVGLEWTPTTSEGVSGYQILSSGAAINNVTSAVYDVQRKTVTAQVYQLAPNTTYTMTVKAIGENGMLSEASQAVIVTTNSVFAPEPPTNLRAAEKTSNTIKLEWEPSTTAEVIEYRIYSGNKQLHNVSQVSYNTTAQSYSATVFNLSPSTAYTFTVKAVSTGGVISEDSNTCSETTGVISGDAANPYTVGNIRASMSDSNVPENAIDNDITTRWSAFGDGQWIELDLGAQRSVGYLGVAFYRGDTRMKAIELEISDDAITWTKVYQGISGGKTAGLEAFGWGEPKQARYVRVIGRGVDEWTSINEIQVYAPHPDGYVLGVLEAPPIGPDPNAPIPTKPGLYDAAGKPHNIHMPDPVTGQTLNVVDYGANPEDNGADDAPAIRAALEAAQPGDEVYIPNGHYQLISTSSDHVSHLQIKSGIQLRGESQDGVLLVSDHANEIGEYATSEGIVIRIAAQHHIRISNMTITSSWNGKYSTDINIANPERGGPKQSIYITGSRGTPSYNITVDHLTVEKFQRMGVAIIFSHDVVVQNSLFRNATDVSGGGSGYGVSIESKPKENRLGRGDDTYFNVVRNNTFIGPYVRHGTIMQYYAHNNLIEHNKYQDITLDAVDFHGEDEYMNEVRNNHFVGGGEAAIGVGNSGATHDASGPGNYIHDNLIENVRRYGVQVYLGSPDTVIENNTIRNFTHSGSQGIRLKNAPGTIVRKNIIENNTAANFWGVVTLYDVGDAAAGGNGAGTPENILIQDNTITGNTNGVDISAGTNILLAGNVISGNTGIDYINRVAVSQELPVLQEISVRKKAKAASSESKGLLIKGGDENSSRQVYMKYDISQVQGSVATAWLYIYGRALESVDEDTPIAHSLYAVTEDDWTKDGMMWANKPILNEKLSTTWVRKDGEDAWYRMDATMFVKEQLAGDKTVSLAITQDSAQAGYLSRFNGSEQDDHRPYLRIETYPPVELASISIKADKMQLLRNDTAQLQVTGKLNTSSTVLLDHADIVYESLTPDTATVTGTGLVTALGMGEAVIQVSATWNGVTKNARITLQVSNNLALISQISVDSTNGSNVKERVIDGNLSTRWVSLASLTGGEPHYLRLDWAEEQSINQLKLWSGHDPVTGSAGWHVRDFDLEYWDGSQWKTLSKVQDNQEDAFYQQATKLVFDTIKTTAIKLKFTKPSWGAGNPNDTTVRINEIEVSLEE